MKWHPVSGCLLFHCTSEITQIVYDKTNIYRVGSVFKTNAKCYTTYQLNWTDEPIEMLGVWLPCDGTEDVRNFDKILQKTQKTLKMWVNRTLTLIGKVIIINTLVSSLFVYQMSTMVNFSEPQLTLINRQIHSFLWNGKKHGRIQMSTMSLHKKQGGLKLVNLRAKQDSIKIQNIFRYSRLLMDTAYQTLSPNLKEKIWKCNMCKEDVLKIFEVETYWVQTLVAWSKINYREPENKQQVLDQIIWLNSNIKIQGKMLHWPNWIKKGIIYVRNIFNTDGSPINWRELCSVYGPVNWLDLKSLIYSILEAWRFMLEDTI